MEIDAPKGSAWHQADSSVQLMAKEITRDRNFFWSAEGELTMNIGGAFDGPDERYFRIFEADLPYIYAAWICNGYLGAVREVGSLMGKIPYAWSFVQETANGK